MYVLVAETRNREHGNNIEKERGRWPCESFEVTITRVKDMIDIYQVPGEYRKAIALRTKDDP